MNDLQIYNLVLSFRKAIERARDAGEFQEDIAFGHFPRRCCGDTSYLLAEFLNRHGAESIWVSMEKDGSHAWLVVKDYRVKRPTSTSYNWPEEMRETLKSYGVEEPEKTLDTSHYTETDLENGLIIDITADQFPDYDISVYVGMVDSFHKQFGFKQAHDYNGLNDLNGRLERLYSVIDRYL